MTVTRASLLPGSFQVLGGPRSMSTLALRTWTYNHSTTTTATTTAVPTRVAKHPRLRARHGAWESDLAADALQKTSKPHAAHSVGRATDWFPRPTTVEPPARPIHTDMEAVRHHLAANRLVRAAPVPNKAIQSTKRALRPATSHEFHGRTFGGTAALGAAFLPARAVELIATKQERPLHGPFRTWPDVVLTNAIEGPTMSTPRGKAGRYPVSVAAIGQGGVLVRSLASQWPQHARAQPIEPTYIVALDEWVAGIDAANGLWRINAPKAERLRRRLHAWARLPAIQRYERARDALAAHFASPRARAARTFATSLAELSDELQRAAVEGSVRLVPEPRAGQDTHGLSLEELAVRASEERRTLKRRMAGFALQAADALLLAHSSMAKSRFRGRAIEVQGPEPRLAILASVLTDTAVHMALDASLQRFQRLAEAVLADGAEETATLKDALDLLLREGSAPPPRHLAGPFPTLRLAIPDLDGALERGDVRAAEEIMMRSAKQVSASLGPILARAVSDMDIQPSLRWRADVRSVAGHLSSSQTGPRSQLPSLSSKLEKATATFEQAVLRSLRAAATVAKPVVAHRTDLRSRLLQARILNMEAEAAPAPGSTGWAALVQDCAEASSVAGEWEDLFGRTSVGVLGQGLVHLVLSPGSASAPSRAAIGRELEAVARYWADRDEEELRRALQRVQSCGKGLEAELSWAADVDSLVGLVTASGNSMAALREAAEHARQMQGSHAFPLPPWTTRLEALQQEFVTMHSVAHDKARRDVERLKAEALRRAELLEHRGRRLKENARHLVTTDVAMTAVNEAMSAARKASALSGSAMASLQMEAGKFLHDLDHFHPAARKAWEEVERCAQCAQMCARATAIRSEWIIFKRTLLLAPFHRLQAALSPSTVAQRFEDATTNLLAASEDGGAVAVDEWSQLAQAVASDVARFRAEVLPLVQTLLQDAMGQAEWRALVDDACGTGEGLVAPKHAITLAAMAHVGRPRLQISVAAVAACADRAAALERAVNEAQLLLARPTTRAGGIGAEPWPSVSQPSTRFLRWKTTRQPANVLSEQDIAHLTAELRIPVLQGEPRLEDGPSDALRSRRCARHILRACLRAVEELPWTAIAPEDVGVPDGLFARVRPADLDQVGSALRQGADAATRARLLAGPSGAVPPDAIRDRRLEDLALRCSQTAGAWDEVVALQEAHEAFVAVAMADTVRRVDRTAVAEQAQTSPQTAAPLDRLARAFLLFAAIFPHGVGSLARQRQPQADDENAHALDAGLDDVRVLTQRLLRACGVALALHVLA